MSANGVTTRPVEFTLNDEQAYFRLTLERNADETLKISLITKFSAEGLAALQPFMKVKWGGQEYSFEPTSDPKVYEIPALTAINETEHSDFEIYLKDKNNVSRTLYQGLNLEEISRPSVHEIKALANTGVLPAVTQDPSSIRRIQVGGKVVGNLQIKTDLHSHLAAIPTGLELLNIATDNGTRPFFYPARLLTDSRVGISNTELKQYEALATKSHAFLPAKMHLEDVKSLKKRGIDANVKGIANQEFLDTAKPDEEYIDINSLTSEHQEKLLKWLSIPPTMQITFDDMEKYYDYREPFTKNLDFFADILELAAQNFEKSGVTHASLSFSKRAVSPEWFAVLDTALPQLKAKYGVTMRFLVGMTRLLSEDAQRDTVEEFKRVAHHPYIEGMDVFGSEINSTWAFYHVLADLAKWCHENNLSHKVLRIHAGETSYHPENVGAAMHLAKEGNIQVRIGHGLFGSSDDKEIMDFYIRNNLSHKVTIEINPDSNYALNHIDSLQSYQMADLARHGIRLVLGSDGHGLYLTDAKQLSDTIARMDLQAPSRAAGSQHEYTQISDLVRISERREIQKIKKAMSKDENAFHHQFITFIQNQLVTLLGEERENAECLLNGYTISCSSSSSSSSSASSSSSSSQALEKIRQQWIQKFVRHQATQYPAYTRSKSYVPTGKQALDEIEARRDELYDSFGDNNTYLLENEDDFSRCIAGKTPILITGGFESEEDLSLAQLEIIRDSIKQLIENSDPEKVCFITTGTNLGLQKYLHSLIQQQTKWRKHFDVIGLVASSAKPDSISPVLSHAILGYKKWFDMHGYIGEKLEQNPHLKVVAIGGNMLTRHIIQTCLNVRRKCQMEGRPVGEVYCVNDIPGASQDKSGNLEPGFSVTLDEMISKLRLLSPENDEHRPRRSKSSGTLGSSSSASSSSHDYELSERIVDEQDKKIRIYSEINGPMGAVDTADQALFMARYLISKGVMADIKDLAETLKEFIARSPEIAAKMPIIDVFMQLEVQGDMHFLEDFKKNLLSLGFELPVILDDILKGRRFAAIVESAKTSQIPTDRMTAAGRGAKVGRGGSLDLAKQNQVARKALDEFQSTKEKIISYAVMRRSIDEMPSTVSKNREIFEAKPPTTPVHGQRTRLFSTHAQLSSEDLGIPSPSPEIRDNEATSLLRGRRRRTGVG
ncbi:hypothetical protein [Candidatus Berkiella aquae]|uniref:Adenosine deaminase n=1 Tax=Candidatus Berkiella aquae TaxID=295108 RepID=A0A0Q9YXH2_9GAMM|nr:hypothetical protein [Candidatus Berkiella aquae]MCS5711312.1 hypothetical protein [Candidatus Berkiella aquae]